jgi:uncharacterized membrane protein
MASVYYVGDRAIQLGPVFAETPFNYAHKGTRIFEYDRWLAEALADGGKHDVESVATWEFYRNPPGRYADILEEADVLVFSDVEAKCFQLDPSFFDRERFGDEPLTFPDRVRLTVEAARRGTHVVFLGGWLSFSGEMGKAGWGRTGLDEILPVECHNHEDLRENTEGFTPEAVLPEHPLLEGIDLDDVPPILGYNEVEPGPESTVLARWRETGDPMLVVGSEGEGKTLAYTSDPAPHWGCNFVHWDGYDRFWENALEWLLE